MKTPNFTTPAKVDTPWMVAAEAASYARCSVKSIYRAVEAGGKLRCARIGDRRALRFRREHIDAWLEATIEPVKASRG